VASFKYKFSFPPKTIHQPLIYHLSREFEVIPNILKGRITEDSAWLEVELVGEGPEVERAVTYLKEQGIDASEME
jgi:ABC-type methionine transport system ATPase subunit